MGFSYNLIWRNIFRPSLKLSFHSNLSRDPRYFVHKHTQTLNHPISGFLQLQKTSGTKLVHPRYPPRLLRAKHGSLHYRVIDHGTDRELSTVDPPLS